MKRPENYIKFLFIVIKFWVADAIFRQAGMVKKLIKSKNRHENIFYFWVLNSVISRFIAVFDALGLSIARKNNKIIKEKIIYFQFWTTISFVVLLFLGCSATQNYAPVRPYPRDLVKAEKFYEVKQGDTLYSIGFRSGHGYHRLARWNNILAPYPLKIGQRLQLFETKQKLRPKKAKPLKTKPIKKKTKSKKKTLTNSNNNKKILKLSWQWPIKGKILKNYYQTGKKGIDIYGRSGQKVKSAAAGKVVYSGNGLKGYGNLLIIKHNYLFLSAYANNRRLLVKEGQKVKKGQVIAEVGQIGSEKTSLHFEIRKNGNPVNPLKYLPNK